MSIDDTISDYIQQQFETFQLAEFDQGSEIAASCRIAASIEKQIQVIILNEPISKVGLDQEHVFSNSDVAGFLVPLLIKYADAALSMETDANNEHVTERVFHLLSAIACGLSLKNEKPIQSIIERIKIFSEVISERLRSRACSLSGCLASHVFTLLVRHENKKPPGHEMRHFRANLSMLESLLVPRLTDKSQSVRQRAIQAAGVFLRKFASVSKVTMGNSRKETNSSSTLLEGLLWSMWHDSSVANRVEAIQAVPIESAEILDHVIARIRDVKEKVRNAAIRAVQDKVDPRQSDIMTKEHFRGIIRSGLTDRCESTNLATMTLICTKWTKAAKFCPVELVRLMGATMYEEECEKALQIVLKLARDCSIVKSNPIFQELSDPEIRSLRLNIDKSIVKLTDSNVVFDEYQLFYTRVFCSSALNHSDLTFAQKDAIMAKTTPDIPSLCDLFQKHLGRLIESIQEGDEECVDQECFVCLQLLQLTKLVGLQEEGSRRYFSRVMIDVLADAETPDDLVEECVQALRATFENEVDFFNTVSIILTKLTSAASSDDDIEDHGRILFIFSVVLESAPSSLSTHALFEVMTKIILSAVANPNKMIREVGIGCFGKLGLFSNTSTVVTEFKPILLKIAAEKEEAIQCRGQSLLALSDWALVFPDVLQPQIESNSGESLSLLLIVREMIQHRNTTLATIAAEVATKLLFSLQIFDTNILASLLVLFLDPNNCKECDETSEPEIDIKDIGSPLRLQQLLSLFFPAFCLNSDERRKKLVGSIENALVLAMDYVPRKNIIHHSKVFPLVSIADYVCSVVSGNGVTTTEVITDKDKIDTDKQKLDLSLSACLQMAKFLVDNVQKLNVTQTRSICKFLGNQEIKLEDNEIVRLGKLKDLVEELSFLEDSSSLKALRPLTDLLSNVKGYEDNYNDIEDEDKEGTLFDTGYDDDDTISENSIEGIAMDSVGETTIEDKVMMSGIARLSLENKENPPAIVKTRRRSRKSSSQSNISVLRSLGSPNT